MTISLKNICSFQSGGTPSKQNSDYFNGNIPWITTVALNGRIIDQNSAVDWITEKAIQESAAKIVPAGSIMVGTRVGVGKVAINAVPMSTSQDIISLVGIDGSKWNKEYLCKFLQSKESFLKSQSRGATIKGIKIDALAALEVPGLPLSEQEKIVSVLNHTLDIIEQRKAQLAALDELVKARFVEMFGDPEYNNKSWPIQTLDQLCSIGSSKRLYQNEQTSRGIPFWRISDLVSKMDNGFVNSNLFISEKKYGELKQSGLVPVANDILVTSRGTIGRCYIIKEEDQFYFQDGMISWLSNYSEKITSLYLQYLFMMPDFRKQINSMQAGSTVAYLSIAMLKKLKVMVPSKELQSDFSNFVSQVDKTKSAVQKYLEKSQLLFDSLMQEYFG